METQGIKETRELLVGANELAIELVKVFKDGVQAVADFSALYARYMGDAELKAKIDAAVANIKGVGDEFKDISLSEGLELATIQISYVPKIIEAAKKV